MTKLMRSKGRDDGIRKGKAGTAEGAGEFRKPRTIVAGVWVEIVRGKAIVIVASLLLFSGCIDIRLPPLGLAGKYQVGRSLLTKPKGAGINEAIPLLEEIAKRDPTYHDTLTLLGRAYYHQGRYQDALQFLQRALVVNKEDEIAWLTLGLTRLKIGDDEAGFENLKTGVALVNKVSKNGYRGYVRWDVNGLVRSAIRRSILIISKDGLAAKEELVRSSELILRRIDDEESLQRGDRAVEERIE